MPVVVVTDSSARLPADLAASYGIQVVPLHILVDGADLRDGDADVPADIHDRHASTAGAAPAELRAAYERALVLSAGDGVVGVHLSAALSSTYSAAEEAAASSHWPRPGLPLAVQAWMRLRPRRVRPPAAPMPTLWCTGWTTCAAADGSAARQPGWELRCR